MPRNGSSATASAVRAAASRAHSAARAVHLDAQPTAGKPLPWSAVLDVVIVSYRCGPMLRQCLQSLRDHPPAGGLRASPSSTTLQATGRPMWSVASSRRCRLIALDENVGFSAANNLVLRETTAEYVLVLNPDTRICEGTLDTLSASDGSGPSESASPAAGSCRRTAPSTMRRDGRFRRPRRRSATSCASDGRITRLRRSPPIERPTSARGRSTQSTAPSCSCGARCSTRSDCSTRATGCTWRISTSATAPPGRLDHVVRAVRRGSPRQGGHERAPPAAASQLRVPLRDVPLLPHAPGRAAERALQRARVRRDLAQVPLFRHGLRRRPSSPPARRSRCRVACAQACPPSASSFRRTTPRRFWRVRSGSVEAQSFRDFEIVLIDDGSTDGTADIARGFSSVRYILGSHGGEAVARNRGLEEARSELVAFVDADDEWLPDKLARQIAFMQKLGSSLSYTDSLRRPRRRPPCALQHARAPSRRRDPGAANRRLARPGVHDPHGRRWPRGCCCRGVGGFEDGLPDPGHVDYGLWLKLAIRGTRFDYLDEPLSLYHRGHPSVSSEAVEMVERHRVAMRYFSTTYDFPAEAQTRIATGPRAEPHNAGRGAAQASAVSARRCRTCVAAALRDFAARAVCSWLGEWGARDPQTPDRTAPERPLLHELVSRARVHVRRRLRAGACEGRPRGGPPGRRAPPCRIEPRPLSAASGRCGEELDPCAVRGNRDASRGPPAVRRATVPRTRSTSGPRPPRIAACATVGSGPTSFTPMYTEPPFPLRSSQAEARSPS